MNAVGPPAARLSEHAVAVEQASAHLNVFTGNQYSKAYKDTLAKRQTLPITARRQDIINMVNNNQVIIVSGTTGSGKSTGLTGYLLSTTGAESRICCTQPRQLAAKGVAQRIADEQDVAVGGDLVGYQYKDTHKCTSKTRLLVVTDGMLKQFARTDRKLSRFTHIVIDEAHERALDTDISMLIVKEACRLRPDLRVIIMSATIDLPKFSRYFDNAPHLEIAGKMFEVVVCYRQPDAGMEMAEYAVAVVLHVHKSGPEGDILVFVDGSSNIGRIVAGLKKAIKNGVQNLWVCPLSASQPQAEKDMATGIHDGSKGRRCTVSTNIAETSLTISGVTHVIDTGLAMIDLYEADTRRHTLTSQAISRNAADQRKGRAGRVSPGMCWRLYSAAAFDSFKPDSTPAMQRTKMTSTILNLVSLDIGRFTELDFLDPPAPDMVAQALEELRNLGCIDDNCKLTRFGAFANECILDPQWALAIWNSIDTKCSFEMIRIAVLAESQHSIFVSPTGDDNQSREEKKQAAQAKNNLTIPDSDHLTLLNVFMAIFNAGLKTDSKYAKAYQEQFCKDNWLSYKAYTDAERDVATIRTTLSRQDPHNQRFKVKMTSPEKAAFQKTILKTIYTGLYMQVAMHIPSLDQSHTKHWRFNIFATNGEAEVAKEHSALTEESHVIVFSKISGSKNTRLEVCSVIKPEWLLDVNTNYYTESASTFCASARRMVAHLKNEKWTVAK